VCFFVLYFFASRAKLSRLGLKCYN